MLGTFFHPESCRSPCSWVFLCVFIFYLYIHPLSETINWHKAPQIIYHILTIHRVSWRCFQLGGAQYAMTGWTSSTQFAAYKAVASAQSLVTSNWKSKEANMIKYAGLGNDLKRCPDKVKISDELSATTFLFTTITLDFSLEKMFFTSLEKALNMLCLVAWVNIDD